MNHELTADDMPLPEVDDPRQRAYLVALVISCGQRGRAALAAGVSRWTVQRWKAGHGDRPPDTKYLKALEVAEEIAAERLEDFAIHRATEGMQSFKFDRNGAPIRHPRRCECGHELVEHEKPRIVTEKAADDVPEPVTTKVRACLACTCEDFTGQPYSETNASDKLMALLLKGAMPDRYAERLTVRTVLRNINWDALPDHLVARIARGENPMAVLASAGEGWESRLLASGVEVGGPGAGERKSDGQESSDREDGDG